MQTRITLLTKMGGFPCGIACHVMDWLFYFISYNGLVEILCIAVSYFVPLYNALANNIDPGFESKLYILSSYCIISKIYFCIESDAQLFEVIESYIGQRIVFFNFFLTSTVCSICAFIIESAFWECLDVLH